MVPNVAQHIRAAFRHGTAQAYDPQGPPPIGFPGVPHGRTAKVRTPHDHNARRRRTKRAASRSILYVFHRPAYLSTMNSQCRAGRHCSRRSVRVRLFRQVPRPIDDTWGRSLILLLPLFARPFRQSGPVLSDQPCITRHQRRPSQRCRIPGELPRLLCRVDAYIARGRRISVRGGHLKSNFPGPPGPTTPSPTCYCGAAVRYSITSRPAPVEADDRHGKPQVLRFLARHLDERSIADTNGIQYRPEQLKLMGLPTI